MSTQVPETGTLKANVVAAFRALRSVARGFRVHAPSPSAGSAIRYRWSRCDRPSTSGASILQPTVRHRRGPAERRDILLARHRRRALHRLRLARNGPTHRRGFIHLVMATDAALRNDAHRIGVVAGVSPLHESPCHQRRTSWSITGTKLTGLATQRLHNVTKSAHPRDVTARSRTSGARQQGGDRLLRIVQ